MGKFYRDERWSNAILVLMCWLVIACVSGHAQDQSQGQPSPSPANPQQTQPSQNQPAPQPPPPEAPPAQSQPQQSQPAQPPPAPPQTEEPQPANSDKAGEKKDSNPAQEAAEKTKEATLDAAEATKKLGEATFVKVREWENGWLTGPYVSRSGQLEPLTGRQRRQIYLQQTLTTPSAYVKRMFVAGMDQLRDSPSQWPEGWEGYGERFASREGQFISANSLAALGDALLKYEPRYDQCKCSGFRLRTQHAILRNFLTYDQSEETLRPQWALYGGALSGGLISTAWKPHPRNALSNAGYAALGQAGYGALLNFFTEFAGDINRKLGARKK